MVAASGQLRNIKHIIALRGVKDNLRRAKVNSNRNVFFLTFLARRSGSPRCGARAGTVWWCRKLYCVPILNIEEGPKALHIKCGVGHGKQTAVEVS